MSIRSLYNTTPSKLFNLSLNRKYGLSSVGRSAFESGNPSSIRLTSLTIESSLLVAKRMSFQVTELMPPMASSSAGHTAGPSGCDLAAIRRVRGIVESLGETWAASSCKVRWLDDPTGCRERASAAA